MDAKEKAKDLVNKFKTPVYQWTGNGYEVDEKATFLGAKHCALIAVYEIIKAIDNLQYQRKTDFWEDVKQEIEKL